MPSVCLIYQLMVDLRKSLIPAPAQRFGCNPGFITLTQVTFLALSTAIALEGDDGDLKPLSQTNIHPHLAQCVDL